MHGLGYQAVGQMFTIFGRLEQIDFIFCNLGMQGGSQFFPVTEEFFQYAGFKDGAGENMCANFRAFFDHTDTDLFAAVFGDLHQTAGRSQSGGACTNDNNIEFY